MNLTPKQEAFCLAYVETGNASEAYRRAYNAAKMSDGAIKVAASRLMDNTNVALTIKSLREAVTNKATKRLEISKDWVLEQLVENVKMAKQAEPVYDNEGNPIGEYKQNLAAGNKALELIGKELGMFVDRKEVRTGPLDGVPYDEKVAALDMIQSEIRRRKAQQVGKNESGRAIH